jgi:hypothetical protein
MQMGQLIFILEEAVVVHVLVVVRLVLVAKVEAVMVRITLMESLV